MDELIRLSDATLATLPADVVRPVYDRSRLSVGIVHIGVGNFHRAHMGWYTHRLMQRGQAMDWAIIGAGVRPYDMRMRQELLNQDCLTTLIELDAGAMAAEITGSMAGYLPVETGNAALIGQIARPSTRIVSLTVTEGGYFRVNDAFEADHEDIVHDAGRAHMPRTAFGAIAAGLKMRRDAGTGPLTVQSCDNLQNNGDIARDTLVSLARLSDPALADWIEAECSFPNAMVDCIVPATGPIERALAHSLGIDDHAPVTHEKFRHWVMEDDFCAGRPDWDEVGAVFTTNVGAFEALKLRILNAGHQIVANPADLFGIETIAGAMAFPLIGRYFRKVAREEILPHLQAVPGFTPQSYLTLIERRFANTSIIDTTRRVAYDGSSRHPGFVIPSIRDAIGCGAPVGGLALAEALWARYCFGERQDGTVIAPNDPHWARLARAAQAARERPAAWLAQRDIYGDLGTDPRFAEEFGRWLSLIWRQGGEAAILRYLDD